MVGVWSGVANGLDAKEKRDRRFGETRGLRATSSAFRPTIPLTPELPPNPGATVGGCYGPAPTLGAIPLRDSDVHDSDQLRVAVLMALSYCSLRGE
jgi:hypothetical protein